MDNTEFLNIYIQTLNNKIDDLTKQQLVAEAKEQFAQIQINNLNEQIVEMKKQVAETERLQNDNDRLRTENVALKDGVVKTQKKKT